MRLTIFGASGQTGRHLVTQALEAGHHLTAVVRDPTRLPIGHQRLKVLVADVLDPAAIGPALAGADAVISVLGPRSYRAASSIISAGTASILAAMGPAGTSRLVVTSAAPVASDDHGTTVAYRLLVAPLLRALLGRGYGDMAAMEEAVRRSGVDWTILRPPRLTDGRRTGTWRQATDANLRGATASPGPTWPRSSWPASRTRTRSRPPSPSATDPMAVAGRGTVRALRRPPGQSAGDGAGPATGGSIGGVMRVLVLGGTGAIGGHVVAALVGQGHAVTALARTPATATTLTAQGATAVSASIVDRSALAAAVAGMEVVVNLSSAVPPMSRFWAARAWRDNDRVRGHGSAAVVDAAMAAGVGRVVQESVAMLYRDHGAGWIDEDAPADRDPTAVFLASDHAAAMTGAVANLTCGMSAD